MSKLEKGYRETPPFATQNNRFNLSNEHNALYIEQITPATFYSPRNNC